MKLNPAAQANAKKMIEAGKVDKDTAWSISADEENEMLGTDHWTEYGKWFLAVDETQPNQETKEYYHYPVGKGGKVYRSALIAIRQRAGQNKLTDVFDAAGELIQLIDGQDDNAGEGKGSYAPVDMRRLEAASVPWALMPEYIAAIANPNAVKSKIGARSAMSTQVAPGMIAVIPINGVITQHPDWMGDTSADEITSDLMMAVSDSTVAAIVLCIDSPGGSVYGIQELASLIAQAKTVKPIVAIANSLAASAAYWLGCAAGEFYCTPSGEVGSIGVWQMHMDVSEALKNAGIKTTMITAGKFKVEGNPYEPLNADALAFMQQRVNDYYSAFTQAVAQARGVKPQAVVDGMGQGRVLGADEAKQQNMIDGVMTLDQVFTMMQGRMKQAAIGQRATYSPLKKAQNELAMLELH